MVVSTFNSQAILVDNSCASSPIYPNSLGGVIRYIKKDLKEHYQFLIKDKNVKEIRITKIDRKNHIMHLWIHKKDRKYIARILSLLRYYPFKHMIFTDNPTLEYLFKCTVEIDPKIIPKGIVVLN